MIISETFIKECDCPKIQEGWEPQLGDRFAFLCIKGRSSGQFMLDVVTGAVEGYPISKDRLCGGINGGIPYVASKVCKIIWLPRPDQLQRL